MEKFEYAILDKQYVGGIKCFVFQGKILNPRIDYEYKKIKYVDESAHTLVTSVVS